MAQHKQLTWTDLRVGLFVLAGAILLTVVIFYVTGGSGWGPKYRLRAYLPQVDGLTLGAPVRVDGVDVGNVEKITIAPAKSESPNAKQRNIEVVMRLQKTYQDYVRSDSSAGLVTEGLLGNQYVDIDRGYVGRVLGDNDEIPGRQEKALKEMVERSADLIESLNSITKQANAVLVDVRNGKGSLGKFLVDEQAYQHLNRSLENVDNMVADIKAGKGTMGKLITDDEMYNHVNSVAGRVDSVLEAVQNQQGTLGKLVYDPALHESIRQFLDNSNGFLADVRNGKGTLGKLATDDSLFASYKQAGENLASATAKMNSNENTIGKFFADPKFYDNFSGLAGDSRLLIQDFRNNPKKFLHVKLSLF
ncbi:MAG TPA: MlaD family protein [Candidatus Acidoferrales bacterium]|nr:MlaD family protein [Candidatus Acidoferrales bacterium]